MLLTQVAIKPFLLACESHSTKLVSLALISLHKLVMTNVLPEEEAMALLKAVEHVERMREEVVQLKILQSSLLLLQSPALADSEVRLAVARAGRCIKAFEARRLMSKAA